MHAEQAFIDAIAAATNEEWRRALTLLRECQRTIRASDLRVFPELMFGAANAAMTGGFQIARELRKIFGGTGHFEPGIWTVRFSRHIMSCAAATVCERVAARDWAMVLRHVHEMIDLPAPTEARQKLIFNLLTRCVDTACSEQHRAIQILIDERRLRRLPSGAWETPQFLEHALGSCQPFDIPAKLLEAVAQSDASGALAGPLLEVILTQAEWPVLVFLNNVITAQLWPEMSALLCDGARLNRLGPAGRDWIERTGRLDPDETAPDEFQNDEPRFDE